MRKQVLLLALVAMCCVAVGMCAEPEPDPQVGWVATLILNPEQVAVGDPPEMGMVEFPEEQLWMFEPGNCVKDVDTGTTALVLGYNLLGKYLFEKAPWTSITCSEIVVSCLGENDFVK